MNGSNPTSGDASGLKGADGGDAFDALQPGSVSFSEYVSILQKHRRDGSKPTVASIREALESRPQVGEANGQVPEKVEFATPGPRGLGRSESHLPTPQPDGIDRNSRSAMILRELVELREELARAEEARADLEEKLQQTSRVAADAVAEAARLRREAAARPEPPRGHDAIAAAEALSAATAAAADWERRFASMQAALESAHAEAEEAVGQTRAWHEYATSLEGTLAEVRTETEAARAEILELRARVDASAHAAAEAEAELDVLRRARDEAARQFEDEATRWHAEAQAAIDSERARAAEAEAELAALRASVARHQDEASELGDLAAYAVSVEAELADARDESDALAAQLFRVREELAALRDAEASRLAEENARLEEEARLAEEARREAERLEEEERVVRLKIAGRDDATSLFLDDDAPGPWIQRLRARPGLILMFVALAAAAYAVGSQLVAKPVFDGMVVAPTFAVVAPADAVVATAEASDRMWVVQGQPLFVLDPTRHPRARVVGGQAVVVAAPADGALRDVEAREGAAVDAGDFLCEVVDYGRAIVEVAIPAGHRRFPGAGDRATVLLDGVEEAFAGSVAEIRENGGGAYSHAVVELDGPVPKSEFGSRVHLGQLAKVEFDRAP